MADWHDENGRVTDWTRIPLDAQLTVAQYQQFIGDHRGPDGVIEIVVDGPRYVPTEGDGWEPDDE